MTEVQQKNRGGRRVLAAVSGALPLVAVIFTWLLWKDTLPASLPSHWSDAGKPDDFMSTASALLITLLVTGIPALVGLIAACMSKVRPAVLRGLLGFAGMTSGLGAVIWLLSAGLTLQTGSAEEVVLGWWLLALFVSLAFGAVPYFIAPKSPVIPVPTAHVRRMPLGEQETGAWSRTISSKMLLWVAVGLLGFTALVVIPAFTEGELATVWISGSTMVLSTILVVMIAHMQVTVDWRGLRIVSTLGRIPLKRIRLADITAVEVIELSPAEWGGWGYRVMPGRSAVIMKAGPGLIVSTTAGKKFAVTVQDPETAASLLLSLQDRTDDGGTHPAGTAQTV